MEEAQNAFDSLGSSDTPEAKAYLQTINSLNAKIALLESQTKDAKEAVTDNNWTKGAQLLNEISSTAREAAGALEEFDEGLGQVVTFIATLASAAKNLITTIQGVTSASSAAGAAMTSMEKASVILAAISVAFQIMQAVFSLLNREDPVAKTRQAFAELNDQPPHSAQSPNTLPGMRKTNLKMREPFLSQENGTEMFQALQTATSWIHLARSMQEPIP